MFRPQLPMEPVNRPSSDFEHLLNMHNITIYKDVTSGKDIMFVHPIRHEYLNDSLYADMALVAAENFCRNPGRNLAGSFCYTLDPMVPLEVCNIRDCTYPEECIVLTDGAWGGRKIYILPQWKERGLQGGLNFALKQWNPDLPDGLEFEIFPQNRGPTIRLLIGANGNEKLMIYFNNKLIKEKTTPHILPSGRWIEFWLQIRKGEVMLGYEGIPSPLFEWKHDDMNFEPFFLSYKSINGYPIGIYFKCDECHTENVTKEYFTHVYPIGLWQPTEGVIRNNFTLKLRGPGKVFIPLMNMPREKDFYMVDIDGNLAKFVKVFNDDADILRKVSLKGNVFFPYNWTNLYMEFNETYFKLSVNGTLLLDYTSQQHPMLFYWFSVATVSWVTWTANCDPLDIDGDPLDGGWGEWSKWQCSVTCGGGDGTRSRTCSNPRPNIFGKLCQGSHESTGRCNEFPCGDISPNTMERVRKHLRTFHFSFLIAKGDSVSIPNDRELLSTIKDESPESYYEWTHNGLFINPEEGRVFVREDAISIKESKTSDAGIYVCMVYRINGQRLVIRVVTLAITTVESTISTRETLPLTLKSNAVILGYIYSDLSQTWLIEDVIYKDYGITTLAAVSTEVITSLNKTHNGVWKCVITQRDLKLSWITNWVRVEIKSAPSMYTHLMEDAVTAPLFGWMKYDAVVFGTLVFIVVLVFGGVAFGVFAYLKWCTLPDRRVRYKKLSNRNND